MKAVEALKSRIGSFINFYVPPVTDNQVDSVKGVINYSIDSQDNYPQLLLKRIKGSETASALTKTKIKYIKGVGLSEHGKEKIGGKTTLQKISDQVATDIGTFRGVYLWINRNAEGVVIDVKRLPFEACRMAEPDGTEVKFIKYNIRYGSTDFKEDETKVYHVYQDNIENWKRIAFNKDGTKNEKYKGEVFHYFIDDSGDYYYPYIYSMSQLRLFHIDEKVTLFHERNTDNNFFLSFVLKLVGNPDSKILDPRIPDNTDRYIRLGELAETELKEKYAGANNGGGVMLLWSAVKDQFPELQAFPTNANDRLFVELENLIVDKIARTIGVPTILANIQTPGKLGSSTEIQNAINLLNNNVEEERMAVETVIAQVMTWFKPGVTAPTIIKMNPLTELPQQVWEVLSLEEKREYVKENYNVKLNGSTNNQP